MNECEETVASPFGHIGQRLVEESLILSDLVLDRFTLFSLHSAPVMAIK